jgi:TetR/AcrR family transcriptional repressor of bet genes
MSEHRPAEERREQIVVAMISTLADHGYAKATIAKIAERAELTPGLLHYHFPNKQAMLAASLAVLAEGQLEQLRGQISAASDPEAALEGVLTTMLAPGANARPQEVAAWVAILAEGIRTEAVRELIAEALLAHRDLLAGVLLDGAEQGSFDLGDSSAEAYAAGLVALIQGYFAVAVTARDVVPPSAALEVAMAMVRGFTATP